MFNMHRTQLRGTQWGCGFTITELLVVISIVGVLVALLLPAIQNAREAARQAQCKNQGKQIGLGLLLLEEAVQHFPAGGWGHEWVGVPSRGAGKTQPGGWIYSSLPYLELDHLHQTGSLADPSFAEESYSQRLRTPICLFVCPSRRACAPWPVSGIQPYLARPRPAGFVMEVARGDYAINSGADTVFSWPGPKSLDEGDSPDYEWPPTRDFTGISHLRIGVSSSEIEDGLSHTYLFGEKFLNPDHYETGESLGDNENIYSGYATDLHRFTRIDLVPTQDTVQPPKRGHLRFGSAHATGCHMVFCDGSVRLIAYGIDAEVHYHQGHRRDHFAGP